MARSFQATATTTTNTSANTSFNNSLVSSQETQATSVNTSFMLDGATDDEEFRPRKSSTSLESLGDPDVLATFTKAERAAFELQEQREKDRIFSQEASRESVSTYDSVDDSVWNEAESKATSATITGSNSKDPVLEPRVATASKGMSESPSRMSWYIRDLPKHNLFVDDLPSELAPCPYFLAFIGCRVAVANNIPITDVIGGLDSTRAQNSPDIFWSHVSKYSQAVLRDPNTVWAAAKNLFEGYTFKGRMVFETARSGLVFKLDLLPIQAEQSNFFQRKFGSDRFLHLSFPSFIDKVDRFSAQMPLIEAQWKLWLHEVHSFLGRKWRVIHVEPIKKKGSVRKAGDADTRVVLFAVEGLGIDIPMSAGHMINQFFDFARNGYQNFCKAFARLDLGLSRTIPTFVFKPSEIRRLRDTLADDTPEAHEYDDDNLDWSERCDDRPVMNDGCAQVSVGAALKIWQCYRTATGSDEPLPSAFQGRIRGAKGMWMISAEPHTRDPAHLETWIEITDSQQKFEPAHEDEADDRPYDTHRLTFNYVNHSFVNGSSDLHISFIPILADRGVSRDVVADFMVSRLDEERRQLLEMLHDPVRLHNWITKQGSATPALGILPWQAALPLSLPEKAKLLLRTGFSPDQTPFLARSLKRFVKQRQFWMEEKLRAPLGKATFLMGLADPLGVLKPGEVHIQFSKPFLDEFDRKTYRHLAGEEVLVARQPACRRSDIQKMRAVSHPSLSHLVDVIVFPSRGKFPAAGKLQGGDYDGDTFWTCWEPGLVEPFYNAPAPLKALDPSKYGIKKDSRKLNEVMRIGDLSTVEHLLKEALDFRTSQSLLGKATNFAEKVAYYENRICSSKLNALHDVHDLLVDAPKQAYRFDEKDFNYLVQRQLRCGNPGIPVYKQAMELSAKLKDIGEEDRDPLKGLRHNPKNILDYLYFDVVRKHNRETRQALSSALPKEEDDDADLQLPFLQLRDQSSGTLDKELDALLQGIEKVVQNWNRSLGDKSELTSEKYNKLLDSCYTTFRSLMPSPANSLHPQIVPLLFPYFGPNHPTIWETIRASALYTAYPKKHSLVWHMAGRELARLKAGANPDTYNVVPGVFADLKTKPNKVVKPEDDEEAGEEDFESALEQQLAG